MSLKNIFKIIFKYYISSIKDNTDSIGISYFRLSLGFCLICVHAIYNWLAIKWSGKCLWKSGKSLGTFFLNFGGNPAG